MCLQISFLLQRVTVTPPWWSIWWFLWCTLTICYGLIHMLGLLGVTTLLGKIINPNPRRSNFRLSPSSNVKSSCLILDKIQLFPHWEGKNLIVRFKSDILTKEDLRSELESILNLYITYITHILSIPNSTDSAKKRGLEIWLWLLIWLCQ